ncbi:hypothetical protein D3C71_1819240 [compost metagenome]
MVVFRNLRAPAVDQLVVEDDAAEQVRGREVTDFGPAVFPVVVVGLVVRGLVVAGDAADQARFVFVDLLALRIVVTVNAVPHAFVAGECGHVLLQIGHCFPLV